MNRRDYESGPLATQTATGAGQTKGIIPTPLGLDHEDLVQRLARFLDWRLRYEAELSLECASSGLCPGYTEADVHQKMARPVPLWRAIKMTKPETQVYQAVRLFGGQPGEWHRIPDPNLEAHNDQRAS